MRDVSQDAGYGTCDDGVRSGISPPKAPIQDRTLDGHAPHIFVIHSDFSIHSSCHDRSASFVTVYDQASRSR